MFYSKLNSSNNIKTKPSPNSTSDIVKQLIPNAIAFVPSSANTSRTSPLAQGRVGDSGHSVGAIGSGTLNIFDRVEFLRAISNPPNTGEIVNKGLVNVGNTCFFNGTIQGMFCLTPLRNLLLKSVELPDGRFHGKGSKTCDHAIKGEMCFMCMLTDLCQVRCCFNEN